jgi:hypothetical protein
MQAQQRHANQMNVQGYLNQQRQMHQQGQQSGASYDPLQPMVESLRAVIKIQQQQLHQAAGEMRTLMNDPKFQKLRNGHWTSYQEGFPTVPGEKCAASFFNMDGMLSVAGLGGYKDPALLILTGKDVPAPRREAQISATLHQSGERPQRVRVFNFKHPRTGLGTIAFAVPSLEAAVMGMDDKSEIAVEINKARIYSLTYHSGKKASASLARCAGGAG